MSKSPTTAHILAVDDDPSIRKMIVDYMGDNQIRVTAVASGREIAAVMERDTVDLLVLDLRLPGEDGMQIARKLREESGLPIIILTGRKEEADRVMGLELGADDYLTKPFSPRELLARIRTVLRRTKSTALAQAQRREIRAYRFAEFELNLRTRRFKRRDGQHIDLTNGEFNLLAALLAAPERILSRDQLLDASRVHENEVYDRSIDVQVLRLRRKIELDPSRPQFIVTERGVGYIFKSPVEAVY
jgi:DNA-binding response OmpR family regulator